MVTTYNLDQPTYNLFCQNKKEQLTPFPPKAMMKARRSKNAPFWHHWNGGRGGPDVPFTGILSKIVTSWSFTYIKHPLIELMLGWTWTAGCSSNRKAVIKQHADSMNPNIQEMPIFTNCHRRLFLKQWYSTLDSYIYAITKRKLLFSTYSTYPSLIQN